MVAIRDGRMQSCRRGRTGIGDAKLRCEAGLSVSGEMLGDELESKSGKKKWRAGMQPNCWMNFIASGFSGGVETTPTWHGFCQGGDDGRDELPRNAAME